MPAFTITRSTTISAPVEEIYAVVRNFQTWPAWSPWLIAEPNCEVTYPSDKSYTWDGQVTGKGQMAITGENANQSIDYQLDIIKPWKSSSQVSFTFAPEGEGTKVTWTMNGSLPFFMFFLKGMMTTLIGMDYERGLTMLKDHIELGSIPSQMDFIARQNIPSCRYVGLKTLCTISEMPEKMGRDFEELKAQITKQEIATSGQPFTIYKKWKLGKGLVEYIIAFPVSDPPRDLDGLLYGERPTCDVYTVKHIGPYRHLGNAWSTGIMHGRSKIFSASRKIPPFEIYQNTMDQVAENELITTVYLPLA